MSVTSNCYAKDLSCLGQPSLGVGYQSCSTSATSTDVITYTLSCTVNALSQCVFGYGSDYTYYNGYSKYFEHTLTLDTYVECPSGTSTIFIAPSTISGDGIVSETIDSALMQKYVDTSGDGNNSNSIANASLVITILLFVLVIVVLIYQCVSSKIKGRGGLLGNNFSASNGVELK